MERRPERRRLEVRRPLDRRVEDVGEERERLLSGWADAVARTIGHS